MKKDIFNTIVPPSFNDYRIDKFLHSEITELSRTRLQTLIHDGHVKLNNIIINDPAKKIKSKNEIKINFPPAKKTLIKPNKIPLDILYDDSDIIIINKFPGVVVHPGAGNYDNTIVNGLLYKYQNKLSSIVGKLRPGIVHRIDKGTSGVIVVAKNDNAHINLSQQFSEHTINRTYEALIWGFLKPQNGIIREKISRSVRNRQLMSVRKEKGKMAITNYKTLKIFQNSNLPKISLIECKLETGRTHQIRVHMTYMGNSIVGDDKYKKKYKKLKNIDMGLESLISKLSRQFLHAKTLGFVHPKTNEEMVFSSILPQDLNNLLKMLRNTSE